MTDVLQISDLHWGRDDKTSDNFRALVRAIKQRWANPTDPRPIILITGDIVDDGIEEQYQQAGVLLEELRQAGFTVLPVPGNHDYGWNGCHAESKRFSMFKKYLVGLRRVTYPDVIEVPDHDMIIVALNSMKSECGFWDGLLADGELGARQLNEIGEIVASLQTRRANGTNVIVALHHHPFLYPDDSFFNKVYEWAGHYLKDGDDFMRIIGDTHPRHTDGPPAKGAVDALLFGHEHRHIDFSRHFTEENLPARYGIPVMLSCGSSTAGDPRKGGFAGWLLAVRDRKIKVENPGLGLVK